MSKNFQRVDLTGLPGRSFVVGDLHGRFDLLEQELEANGFDKAIDHLFSVGDLVDRGPYSTDALEYSKQDWFHHVKGNHELMTLTHGGTDWHVSNGGKWFNDLPDFETKKLHAYGLNDAPFIMEVLTQSGKKIGLVHAGLPSKQIQGNVFIVPHWDDLETYSDIWYEHNEEALVWGREQYYRARKASERPNVHRLAEFTIEGVDHVFMGHTPIKAPLTVGNMSWIDTGAFATNVLTLVEV
jgi:serine/threonine protein phosphatase 1